MNTHRVTLLVTLDVETGRTAGGVQYALRGSKNLRRALELGVGRELLCIGRERVTAKSSLKKLKVNVS